MLSKKESWIKSVAVGIWNKTWDRTPAKFRRMTVLSSLYAVMMQCDESDKDRLCSLNEQLGLTRDINCMRFAVLLAPKWWRNRLHSQPQAKEASNEIYVRYLARCIPCWLRYGSDDEVHQDLHRLLQFCNRECSLA